MKKENQERRKRKAKVLFFDENLGWGILKPEDSKERLRFTYRDVEGEEGFIIFFEGEEVEFWFKNGKIKVKRSGKV